MKPAILIAAGLGAALAAGGAGASALASTRAPNSVAWNNLRAFLAVIRDGESTGNYFALVGGGEFEDDSAHPKISEGWPGITRADGRLTTAAGAYQITFTTYQSLGGGAFDPESQDRMAIRLLMRRGAYDLICAGDIQRAVSLLRDEWEIFTLPRFSPANSVSMFESNGGFSA